ncbi:cytochrome P450 [Mycena leptocephala]|nr:cytochrome P450 [Mycena leptocephala]
MLQLVLAPTYGDYEFNWQKLYGPVYRLKGCFGEDRLMVSDPVSLQYILNSPHFAFGPNLENLVHLLHGKKSIPGVNAAAVRQYMPLFEKAAQTATVLGCSAEDLGEEFILNFQIISLAATQSASQILADAIGGRLPKWVWSAAIHLPTQTFKVIRRAQHLAILLGTRVIQEKRAAAHKGLDIATDLFGQLLELTDSDKTKNALAVDEIVAQTAVLMVAGQAIVSAANTLAFGLVELARAPDLQEELHAEIHATLGSGRARSVAYDNMPLLNASIKETLRMYPAGAITERVAVQDMVIPLTESITTSTGERISQIPVHKDSSHAGVRMHTSLSRPVGSMVWRTKERQVLEMQVFLCELVGKFSFSLPEDGGTRTCLAATLRPTLSNGQKGAQLFIERIA